MKNLLKNNFNDLDFGSLILDNQLFPLKNIIEKNQ